MAAYRSDRTQAVGSVPANATRPSRLMRTQFLSMISLMAAVMAAQAGLVRQVQYGTASKHSAGSAAAAMLFIFEGAFTIGFQATVWVYP